MARTRVVYAGLAASDAMVAALTWARAAPPPPVSAVESATRVAAVPFTAAPAIPRTVRRLGCDDIGLVNITADPCSVAVSGPPSHR